MTAFFKALVSTIKINKHYMRKKYVTKYTITKRKECKLSFAKCTSFVQQHKSYM